MKRTNFGNEVSRVILNCVAIMRLKLPIIQNKLIRQGLVFDDLSLDKPVFRELFSTVCTEVRKGPSSGDYGEMLL